MENRIHGGLTVHARSFCVTDIRVLVEREKYMHHVATAAKVVYLIVASAALSLRKENGQKTYSAWPMGKSKLRKDLTSQGKYVNKMFFFHFRKESIY